MHCEQMYAVDLDRGNMIVFSPAPVPEALAAEFRDRYGAEVRGGITLDYPPDFGDRPAGAEPPAPALYVARSDPRRFVVFKHPRDVAGDVEPTGKLFHILPAGRPWQTFADPLRMLDDIARAGVGGVEAVGDFEDDDAGPTAAAAGGRAGGR